MFKNYCKIIIRNIVRHKGYTFLNVSGLAIGIAVTSLILLYVKFEWEYDKSYPNADSIYRLIQRLPGKPFMGTEYFAVTQEPLGRTLQSEFPDVNNYVTISTWNNAAITIDRKNNFEENILCATAPNLFQMFSYGFIQGDPHTVLSQQNTVVLSENIAKKYFGNDNPVGKTITVLEKEIWTVTGVFSSMPANSQFANYGMITSFETYASTLKNREQTFTWRNNSWHTYVQLKNKTNPEYVQAKLPSIVKKYINNADDNIKVRELYLQPLKDIHLYNKAYFGMGQNGDLKTIFVLIAVALIILAIACMNYINLSTARSSLKAREVGVRKVIGANKIQLISQFIGDSIVLSIAAGIFALILDLLFLPSFNQLVGIEFSSTALLQPSFLIGFIVITLLTGLLSGIYPAFVLSDYQPAQVIKGDKAQGRHSFLRRFLVVTQFAASIALIACTFIILLQMNYIRNKDMGYNRENIIVLPLKDASVVKQLEPMKHDLNQYPSITKVTACSQSPIGIHSATYVKIPGETGKMSVLSYHIDCDYDFLSTFDISVVEGRNFSKYVTSDSANAVLVNQSLANSLGLKNAVDKTINIDNNKFNIIGVIKDFNIHSLHQKILPFFVKLNKPWMQYLCIKTKPENLPATIEFIQSVWNQYNEEKVFKYTFLDSDFNSLYKAEERLAKIVHYSSCLAILVACLGLLGLVSFIVEQKRKEIGIRKVLGASVVNVVGILSKQFLLMVLLANIIAIPIAYYFMSNWLEDFAYRINISWWIFAVSGAIALLIALLTVSYQAIKAAIANPVESLRYE